MSKEVDRYYTSEATRSMAEEIAALRAEVERLRAGDEQRVRDLTKHITRADAAEAEVERLRNEADTNAMLRAEVERVTDVAYSHCLRADAREADIERITAHYAGAMELANRKVLSLTELLRRAVPLVAFCAPKDSTLGEEIRRAIHE